MAGKSIIIIGAGMGGLAAGIYGQVNGYNTRIFELHTQPGGQCTAWKRNGYTFDACVHHLFGCEPKSSIYQLWRELGAMPRPMIELAECTSVLSPEGKLFVDYYDLEKLEKHLLELSPKDKEAIKEYISGIKLFMKKDVMDPMLNPSRIKMLKLLPSMPFMAKWLNTSCGRFAEKFTDPFLRMAFPLLVYSMPATPVFFHLVRHAYGISKNIRWPEGGALEFSKSIEKRYLELGGKIDYRSRVAKILVEGDKAVGVKLGDGTEYRADIVISNADGRKTIMEMLGGKYINDVVKGYCDEPDDETIMAVNVFLGVNRDMSGEPSAMIILLEEPEMIANKECESLEIQIYGFDKSMAPQGKTAIKVELTSSYKYWKGLYADREKYNRVKQKVADRVIALLDKHFTGLRNQVEASDVTTLVTWERYMGGTHGWFNMPKRKMNMGIMQGNSNKNWESTLPGLDNFYLTGVWATMTGALFINANSGRQTIQQICRRDGKKFKAE